MTWVIGLYAIMFGVTLVTLAVRLRELGRSIGTPAGDQGRPAPA